MVSVLRGDISIAPQAYPVWGIYSMCESAP